MNRILASSATIVTFLAIGFSGCSSSGDDDSGAPPTQNNDTEKTNSTDKTNTSSGGSSNKTQTSTCYTYESGLQYQYTACTGNFSDFLDSTKSTGNYTCCKGQSCVDSPFFTTSDSTRTPLKVCQDLSSRRAMYQNQNLLH
jgi:hypothetical protein